MIAPQGRWSGQEALLSGAACAVGFDLGQLDQIVDEVDGVGHTPPPATPTSQRPRYALADFA
jgi:hypothetical protein